MRRAVQPKRAAKPKEGSQRSFGDQRTNGVSTRAMKAAAAQKPTKASARACTAATEAATLPKKRSRTVKTKRSAAKGQPAKKRARSDATLAPSGQEELEKEEQKQAETHERSKQEDEHDELQEQSALHRVERQQKEGEGRDRSKPEGAAPISAVSGAHLSKAQSGQSDVVDLTQSPALQPRQSKKTDLTANDDLQVMSASRAMPTKRKTVLAGIKSLKAYHAHVGDALYVCPPPIPKSIPDIDLFDYREPQFCAEYVREIFTYMHEKELETGIVDYLKNQEQIEEKHRVILVDWMSEVAVKFRMIVESTFLAVQMLDRFLTVHQIDRTKLQLVGVTCMMIAAKFEEVLTPEVNDFVWICAKAYTREEVLQMERMILTTLDFNLSIPTPLHFLRRFSKSAGSDSRIHTLCKYITEVSMLDYKVSQQRQSIIAAAAVYVGRSMTICKEQRGETPWNATLEHYTRISEQDLLPCARLLNETLKCQPHAKYRSAYMRYESDNMFAVSKMEHVQI